MLIFQKARQHSFISKFCFHSDLFRLNLDADKVEIATVEIPEKQWTLVIGYDFNDEACKYTVSVNGV